MSHRLEQPASRLICFGGAKALTMAVQNGDPEDDIGSGKELF